LGLGSPDFLGAAEIAIFLHHINNADLTQPTNNLTTKKARIGHYHT